MDGLDLLKKDWNKTSKFPKVNELDIYRMIHKKSSSIVKWIFVISVLEIALWAAISFLFADEKQRKVFDGIKLSTFVDIYTVAHWIIVVFFVVLFYRNFRMIENTASAKTLMGSILRTRKIVTWYVWYNLISLFVVTMVVYGCMLMYDQNLNTILKKADTENMRMGMVVLYLVSCLLVTLVLIGLMWLFYRLIYGILLKRLKTNFEELEKMELQ